jgi:phosphinothricin acetyltransferase
MMPLAIIRPAGEDDLADILRIYNQAIEKTTAVFEYRPHTLEMRRDWFKAKQAASLPVLVAVESGAVLGFASYGPFRAWPAYKYSVELSVYVDESARGRGIGGALVRSVLASAREHDLHVVMAGITSDNAVSLRLHERLGFVEVAHIRQVGYKFGRWLDLKLLQVVLDGPRQPTDS